MAESKPPEVQNEIDYQQLAEELFQEHNNLRKDPKSYIEKLTKAENFYKDKIFRHPNEIPIETYEGIQGIKNAIEFLKNQNPVKELTYSESLSKSALDHANDIGKQRTSERIEKYIEWDGDIAEKHRILLRIS